jgi:hypothetical protein
LSAISAMMPLAVPGGKYTLSTPVTSGERMKCNDGRRYRPLPAIRATDRITGDET